MVLETSWATPTGWLVVRDALMMGPWHHETELSHTHRRTPTDYDADHVLLRTIRCVTRRGAGHVRAASRSSTTAAPGRPGSTPTAAYAQAVCRAASPERPAVDADPDHRHAARVRGRPGHGPDPDAGRRDALRRPVLDRCTRRRSAYEEARRRLVWTAHHWQHWLARGRFPDHPWSRYLQRSALTLKGLTFAPSGAMVAAATTSLPEVPHGERNWDYRYCWLRDSAFTLWSLYALGFDWEADDFFWFLADLAQRDDEVQVVYGVDGERVLSERILDHLSGYDGARPVRVGNEAYTQRQHDVWGTMLQAIHITAGQLAAAGRPDVAGGAPPGGVGAEVLARARPGHLGGARANRSTSRSSKLMCWSRGRARGPGGGPG